MTSIAVKAWVPKFLALSDDGSKAARCADLAPVIVWTTLNFIADIFNVDIPQLMVSPKLMFFINIASIPVDAKATPDINANRLIQRMFRDSI